jgi:hypothetical protein
MRRKKSKFDPYLNEITEYAAAGMTVQGIAERIQKYFEDYVEESAVYAFMRSRGIQSRVTQGGTNLNYKAPRCTDCDNCITVINTTGKDVLLCLAAKRIVNRTCTTSPMWCQKRGDLGETAQKMDTGRI